MDKIIKRFSEIKSENKDLVVKLMSKAAKNEQTIYGEVSDWIRDYHSDLSLLEREVLAKMLLGDLVIHHSELLQPKNPAKDITKKRKVRLRIGITLCGDEQDIEQVVSGKDGRENTLMRLMKESSFVIDGDTYIPEPCIEQYNEDYGTTHEVGDVGFNLYDATEYHIVPAE